MSQPARLQRQGGESHPSLLTIALPGVILLLLAPIVLLAAAAAIPAVFVGALLGPPWLVVRMVRRHRARS